MKKIFSILFALALMLPVLSAQASTEFCPDCNGSGVCQECNGSGYSPYDEDELCDECDGSGNCQTCYGSGYVEVDDYDY